MTQAEDVQKIRDRGDAKHEHVLQGYLKFVLWATAIVVVVSFVSVVRSFYIQDSVDRLSEQTKILEQQTDETKAAAVEARDSLTAAINRLDSTGGLTSDSIGNALIAITRIEQQLCGGPCDE